MTGYPLNQDELDRLESVAKAADDRNRGWLERAEQARVEAVQRSAQETADREPATTR